MGGGGADAAADDVIDGRGMEEVWSKLPKWNDFGPPTPDIPLADPKLETEVRRLVESSCRKDLCDPLWG